MDRQEIQRHLEAAQRGCAAKAASIRAASQQADKTLDAPRALALQSQADQWLRAAKAIEAAGHALPKERKP